MIRKRQAIPACLLLVVLLALPRCSEKAPSLPPRGEVHTWVTWKGMEADKCACIWLIQRFVDAKAEFVFIDPGQTVVAGIPFDTPDAEIRRYHDRSGFEVAIDKYRLQGQAIKQIGEIIRDIEINYWGGPKKRPESEKVNEEIVALIESAGKDDAQAAQACYRYFDRMYDGLGGGAASR